MNPLVLLGFAVLIICAACFVVAAWADDTVEADPAEPDQDVTR